MLLKLDFSIDIPIYQQIRNQIVLGIAKGQLAAGEKLPPIRQLASELGVNTMTVNKSYQLLKQEGYLIIDRRNGAMVAPSAVEFQPSPIDSHELRLILSEFYLQGVSKNEMLQACETIYDELIANVQKTT